MARKEYSQFRCKAKRSIRLLCCAIAAALMGCIPASETHVPPPPTRTTPIANIVLRDNGFAIGQDSFTYPLTYESIVEKLGSPDRSRYVNSSHIRVWDQLGILTMDVFELDGIGIKFGPNSVDPTGLYDGIVTFKGEVLSGNSTADDLERLGFKQDSQLPMYWMCEGKMSNVLAQIKYGYLVYLELQRISD